MLSRTRFAHALLAVSALTLISGCSSVGTIATSSASPSVAIRGTVHGGQQAVSGATIQLYSVGTTGDGSAATALGTSTTTAGDGSFSLTGKYLCSNATNGVNTLVYLVSTGGNPGSGTNANLVMMAALGQCSSLTSGTFINIDEVTTVGSIAALYSPYMTSATNLGSAPGDAAAFATAFGNVAEYTNTSTGTAPGTSLPGGYYASSTEIDTLSNIVASCVNSTGGAAVGSNSSDGSACGNLFNLTRNGGVAPTNTIAALINILNNPTQNASALFSLPQPNAPFQPSLSTAPTTWALPILPIAATPTFSVGTGTYSSAQFVILSDSSTGAVIHYTLDGSTPTAGSATYSGTITVLSSETLKAVALGGGFASSAVASAAYTITGSILTNSVGGQFTLANECGGNSLPPITVTLAQGTTVIQTTTSDDMGVYTFSGVPYGTYTVTPSITGPSSIFYPVSQVAAVSGATPASTSFSANLGYTVSGMVTYTGPQTGRTYLTLNSTCGGQHGSGTSISTSGAYTIRGVSPGTYTVQAWMDPLGQGTQNAIDPIINPASLTSLSVTNANLTNATVSLIDPTFAPPTSNPTIQSIIPNPQGALIVFQPSENSSFVEDANQYVVEWSTSPTLGGGSGGAQFASVAGSRIFTANGDKGLWILTPASLTGGQTYYFQARAFNTLNGNSHPSGWCNYTSSGCNGTSGFLPVTIAEPSCSGTCTMVSGSVTIPAAITIKPGAQLYLGLLQFSNGSGGDPNGIYFTEIASPSNGSNNFTVTVPSGSNYAVGGILDQNNIGGFGVGTITNIGDKVQANLIISGITQPVAGVSLPTSNSAAAVSTQFLSNSCLGCGSTSTSYQLTFDVSGLDKLPVAVTLNSGPNMPSINGTIAMDMGICADCGGGKFEFGLSLLSPPNVGDTYGFTVTYSDGTQDTGTTVAGAVTGWNGGSTVADASDTPTALTPNNTSSTSTTPTFTWTDATNAMGANFYYRFDLYNFSTCSGNCQIWQVPGNNSKSNGFSNSITSIPWITSGNDVTGASNNLPSPTSLTANTVYTWQVQVQDSNGNSAQTQVQYQP